MRTEKVESRMFRITKKRDELDIVAKQSKILSKSNDGNTPIEGYRQNREMNEYTQNNTRTNT